LTFIFRENDQYSVINQRIIAFSDQVTIKRTTRRLLLLKSIKYMPFVKLDL